MIITVEGFIALKNENVALREQLLKAGIEPAPESDFASGSLKRIARISKAAAQSSPALASAANKSLPQDVQDPFAEARKNRAEHFAKQESAKQKALAVRAQYAACSDSNARAKFWAEHREEMFTS